jgi:hypothetical protein
MQIEAQRRGGGTTIPIIKLGVRRRVVGQIHSREIPPVPISELGEWALADRLFGVVLRGVYVCVCV